MLKPLLISLTIITGIASQYAPGVMEQVISTRQAGLARATLPAGLPPVAGYVAVIDCSRIGEVVWLRPVGETGWEPFLVTDCANPADGSDVWMTQNGILVEVDYNTAVRWSTVSHGIAIEMMVRKAPLRRYEAQ